MKDDTWYVVIPRGDKLDLTDSSAVFPNAIFKNKSSALKFAKKWQPFVDVVPIAMFISNNPMIGNFYAQSKKNKEEKLCQQISKK